MSRRRRRMGGITPASYGNLWTWLDPGTINQAHDSAVASWTPRAGSMVSPLTAVGAAQPTYKVGARNGKPAVFFDGNNDVLSTAISAFGDVSVTFVAAFQGDDVSQAGLFDINNGSNTNTGVSYFRDTPSSIVRAYSGGNKDAVIADASTSWQVVSGRFTRNVDLVARINGGAWSAPTAITTLTEAVNLDGFDVGSLQPTSNYFMTGQAGMIAIYQAALTDAQVSSLEKWMGSYYAIAVT